MARIIHKKAVREMKKYLDKLPLDHLEFEYSGRHIKVIATKGKMTMRMPIPGTPKGHSTLTGHLKRQFKKFAEEN